MPMAMPSNDLMKVIDNAVKAAEQHGRQLRNHRAPAHRAWLEDKGDAGRVLNVPRRHAEEPSRRRTRYLRGSTRVTDQQSKA